MKLNLSPQQDRNKDCRWREGVLGWKKTGPPPEDGVPFRQAGPAQDPSVAGVGIPTSNPPPPEGSRRGGLLVKS